MTLTVVFYVFVVFTAIQIVYHLFFSSFLFTSKKIKKSNSKVPISLIIYAKNEAENLRNFLPIYLDQKYPDFQIVVINDASFDETEDLLEEFKEKHQDLKIITVENVEAFWGNKKYGLTLGIKAAKHEHLLFTDAATKPTSEFWISEMSHHFFRKKTIVIGYASYFKEKSLFNLYARFDHILSSIQYLSFAKSATAYKATSKNLAYTKSEFFSVKGFINHIKIKNGEDDLFLKDAGSKKNTTICISENSFVETKAPKNFRNWYSQKLNSLAIKEKYKFKHKFFLSLFVFSKLMFYCLVIPLFFFYPWKLILPLVLGYFLVQLIVIGFSAKKLKETQIIYFLPFLDIAFILLQIGIFIAYLNSKKSN